MWWIGSSSTAVTPSELQVLDRGLGREAGVGAAKILAHLLVQLREALDVRLVDDRLVPRACRRTVVFPVERARRPRRTSGSRRRRPRRRRRGRRPRRRARRASRSPRGSRPGPRSPSRRVDQQLRRVEALTLLGLVRSVHAVAVALARADAREVAVPVEDGVLADARRVSRCRRRRTGRARRARRSRRRARSSCRRPSHAGPSGKRRPGQTSISDDLRGQVREVGDELDARHGARAGRGASRRRRRLTSRGSVRRSASSSA